MSLARRGPRPVGRPGHGLLPLRQRRLDRRRTRSRPGFGAWGSFEEVLTRNEARAAQRARARRRPTPPTTSSACSATSTPRAWTPTPSRPPASPRSSTCSTPSPPSTRPQAFLDLHAPFLRERRHPAVRARAPPSTTRTRAATCCGSSRAASASRTATRTSPTARPRSRCGRRTSTTSPPSCATPARRPTRPPRSPPRVLELETRLAEPQLQGRGAPRPRPHPQQAQRRRARRPRPGARPARRTSPPSARPRAQVVNVSEPGVPRGAARDRRRRPTSRCCGPTPPSTSSRRPPTRCPPRSRTRRSSSTASAIEGKQEPQGPLEARRRPRSAPTWARRSSQLFVRRHLLRGGQGARRRRWSTRSSPRCATRSQTRDLDERRRPAAQALHQARRRSA